MGNTATKFRKALVNGDEALAWQLYEGNPQFRDGLDPNASYGEPYQHNTALHYACRHAMTRLLRYPHTHTHTYTRTHTSILCGIFAQVACRTHRVTHAVNVSPSDWSRNEERYSALNIAEREKNWRKGKEN